MNNLKTLTFLFLLSAMIWSCKEEKKDPSAEMMKEVLATHDEVMPKMGRVAKLANQLKSKVDSTSEGLIYASVMKDLQDANAEMMEWMQMFSNRFDTDEIMNGKELTLEKKRWLKEEKQKIEALKQNIEIAISEAEVLLKTNKN